MKAPRWLVLVSQAALVLVALAPAASFALGCAGLPAPLVDAARATTQAANDPLAQAVAGRSEIAAIVFYAVSGLAGLVLGIDQALRRNAERKKRP